MYGYFDNHFNFHLLPIKTRDAFSLRNVYYKIWTLPLILFPYFSKKQEYQCICPNDVYQAVQGYCVKSMKFAAKGMICTYNRFASTAKLKPVRLPQLLLVAPTKKSEIDDAPIVLKDKLIVDNQKPKKENLSSSEQHEIQPYCGGDFASTRFMIEQYISSRCHSINVKPTKTEYLVRLPNTKVTICNENEIKMMFTYKEQLFIQVLPTLDIIPIQRSIPKFILSMFDSGYASTCSYFLQMSYKVRKYLGCGNKPCKRETLFKHMETIYNNYEFNYGQETTFLDIYLDAIDSEYTDVDTFIDELRFLGYTINNGRIQHLKRRNHPLDVTIENNKRKCDLDTYAHKILRQPCGNDMRPTPLNPFFNVSPFNTASL